jgi:glycosyltransferase involved in cell wall biosynthesis
MFEPNNGLSGWIEKLVMKFVNRGVSLYWVYSSKELEIFPILWGVEPEKMRFCPFYMDPGRTHSVDKSKKRENYIFSGGNSHRNYKQLLDAARQLPDHKFFFATALKIPTDHLPENVTIDWPSLEEYIQLMSHAAVIILPLRTDLHRTVGLLTLLEAMSLEQVVIASNAMGIEDYIKDMETGLIVDGSPENYIRAIEWAFSPENAEKMKTMRKNAKRSVLEQFSISGLVDNLIPIINEAKAIKESWNS